MGLGERIETLIQERRRLRLLADASAHGDFYRAGGNELLCGDLPLGSDDVVIDAGGYRGEWTDEVLCRYGCRSIIFEPVPHFASALSARYRKNNRVDVVAAALGGHDGSANVTVAENSSTVSAAPAAGALQVPLVDIAEFIRRRNIGNIACVKLNIEGGEYDVLERLADTDLLGSVKMFLIQFHDVAADSRHRRNQVRNALAASHRTGFDFPFVWESWVRAEAM